MSEVWVMVDEELVVHLLDCGDANYRPGSVMMQVSPDTKIIDILTMVQMVKDGTMQEMKDRGMLQ